MENDNPEIVTEYDIDLFNTFAFHTNCINEYTIHFVNYPFGRFMNDNEITEITDHQFGNESIQFRRYYALIRLHDDIRQYLTHIELTGNIGDHTQHIRACQQRFTDNERFYSEALRNTFRTWMAIHEGAVNV